MPQPVPYSSTASDHRLMKHGIEEDIIFIALGGEAEKGCNLCLAIMLQQKNVEERS
jgi:hypothetical protein